MMMASLDWVLRTCPGQTPLGVCAAAPVFSTNVPGSCPLENESFCGTERSNAFPKLPFLKLAVLPQASPTVCDSLHLPAPAVAALCCPLGQPPVQPEKAPGDHRPGGHCPACPLRWCPSTSRCTRRAGPCAGQLCRTGRQQGTEERTGRAVPRGTAEGGEHSGEHSRLFCPITHHLTPHFKIKSSVFCNTRNHASIQHASRTRFVADVYY